MLFTVLPANPIFEYYGAAGGSEGPRIINEYLEYLLTEIPKYMDNKFLDNLLPWTETLPANIRKSEKPEDK